MAKYYRGDTFPIVASYEGYTFKRGDKVTGGILSEDLNVLAEVTVEVTGDCDAVQLELSREQMHDVSGDCIIEVRTVTADNVEMTIQKKITFEEDGLR